MLSRFPQLRGQTGVYSIRSNWGLAISIPFKGTTDADGLGAQRVWQCSPGDQGMNLARLVKTSSLIVLLTAVTVAGWAQAPPPPNTPDQNAQYGNGSEQGPPGQDYADQNGSMQGGPGQAGDNEGPPGRVARLQFMSGSVSIQPHGSDEWVQGSVNRPLTNADNIWADKDSRAELNLGTGLLRISNESSLTLTNVIDNSAQVQLHQGALSVHVRHLFKGEVYEIDTPNLAFTIDKPGDYRFDVDPNADYTKV